MSTKPTGKTDHAGSHQRLEAPRAEADAPTVTHPKRLQTVSAAGNALLSAAVIGASIVSLFARDFWLAELIANLRVQLAIGILAAMLSSVLFRRWKMLVLLTSLLGFHGLAFRAAWIREPVTRGARGDFGSGGSDASASVEDSAFRICTANVNSANRNDDRILEILKQTRADVIAIIELNFSLSARLKSEMADAFPHQWHVPGDEHNFGIGLISRDLLRNAQTMFLNDKRIPSIRAIVETPRGPLLVIATHTLPPMTPMARTHRDLHLSLLARRIGEFRATEPNTPVVVLGDLNLTPWTPTFREFQSAAKLRNASSGYGLSPTWFAAKNFAFGLQLDHCLTEKFVDCVARTVEPDFHSDHRAVTFELQPHRER